MEIVTVPNNLKPLYTYKDRNDTLSLQASLCIEYISKLILIKPIHLHILQRLLIFNGNISHIDIQLQCDFQMSCRELTTSPG